VNEKRAAPANDIGVVDRMASDREVWEKRAQQPLTEDDLRSIRSNIAGFFRLLAEWEQQERDTQ